MTVVVEDRTSVRTLREGVGALEEVAMMTRVVTFHAMTIAGDCGRLRVSPWRMAARRSEEKAAK